MLMAVAVTGAPTDSLTWESDTTMAGDTTVQVEEMNSVTSTAAPAVETVEAPQPVLDRSTKTLWWMVLATAMGTLLAVASGVMAFLARREVADMQETYNKALEQTNNDMRRLAEESAREVNALRMQVARMAAATPARATVVKEPQHQRSAQQPPQPSGPQTFYLAKPDAEGVFTRVSTAFELGNSLFLLTTADGVRGTFTVIDNADVHRFALMMPTDNLTRACSGEGIQLSAGRERIVTDAPGEAVMENGSWHVVRKALIRYA